ncbi:protein folded gastrulation [Calliphora vicina]|uniref:protein folded gastrulation n=1 Tax=Calliphora vicina TaxID=7373 RepID=UPI00325B55F0
MYFTPTIFIAQLLAAMQVLMTLDMPLSTTMALPVTSKPIESTVENLAWQAWIELPPEQKQQVKSRKVTPKSIFTLPLRVECPQGHKQVDTKCIPIVIGSNDVLIDLNALGLLVGNTQNDELYDYDDMGEEMGNPLPYGSEMPMGESEKSVEGITVEFKPPSKDEPLKFNIFQNKFNIFHEEPLEDYSSISYEGMQSSEKEQNVVVTTAQPTNETSITPTNITAINDLVSEASNISENNFEIYLQHREKNSSASDNEAAESNTLTTLADDADFKIEAISVPASGFEQQKPNKLSIIQNDSSIQLVTTIMDTETTTTTDDDHDKPQENDLQTLLQTESFLPMLQQATATTLQDSLTTVSLQEPNESSSDALSLNVDEEEMTTLPNIMEQELEVKDKQEYTRSVTLNPLMNDASDSDVDDNDDNDLVKDTTLEAVTNDEPLETTTPIQLDDTTIIETSSSLSTTPSTKQQELTELLLQQEQIEKDFEELQRMRKGQKDHQQHVVSKKSKVEPVEVLATTTAATTTTTTIETTTATSLQAETKTQDELISTTAETAAVTPLLTVHNENDNNDRFYYQHFAKPDIEVTAATTVTDAAAAATKAADMETIPLTSEIDLAEELRLINELVKGIRPATTLTTIKTMQASTTSTTTTTSEQPMTSSITTSKTTLPDEVQSTTSPASLSESSTVATKPTPSTSQIWSKIMPLLTTQTPKRSSHESFKSSTESSTLSTQEDSNDVQTKESTSSSSTRSNRNSKIIRINGFNSISTGKLLQSLSTTTTTSTTTAATTTIIEDSTPSESTTSSSSSSTASVDSSTENNTYEPYWWLPVAWRLDKPTNSDKQPEAEQEVKTVEQPLLLRFWSAYHAPKSS